MSNPSGKNGKNKAAESGKPLIPAVDALPLEEGEVKTRIVAVTPEKARRWLERNHPDNRAIAPNRVEAMTGDMRDGNWRLTHQGIAFDSEGRLIDGQHRLSAIVASGATVRLMVTWNVGAHGDPIDCGRPRSLAVLSRLSTRDVGAVNCLRMLGLGNRDAHPMTLAELREVCGQHSAALEAVSAVPRAQKMLAGVRAALAYAYPIAPELVLDLSNQIASAERLVRGEPAFALFHWKEGNKNVASWDCAMAALNAIRHHLAGQALRALYTTPSGYRAITSKRRAMRVPHTPLADLVLAGPTLQSGRARHPVEERGPVPSATTTPVTPRAVVTFEED